MARQGQGQGQGRGQGIKGRVMGNSSSRQGVQVMAGWEGRTSLYEERGLNLLPTLPLFNPPHFLLPMLPSLPPPLPPGSWPGQAAAADPPVSGCPPLSQGGRRVSAWARSLPPSKTSSRCLSHRSLFHWTAPARCELSERVRGPRGQGQGWAPGQTWSKL